jgi:hypothetical protein
VLKGKYIDATQDQQDIIDNIKEVNEKELYVMKVDQLETARPNIYDEAPVKNY